MSAIIATLEMDHPDNISVPQVLKSTTLSYKNTRALQKQCLATVIQVREDLKIHTPANYSVDDMERDYPFLNASFYERNVNYVTNKFETTAEFGDKMRKLFKAAHDVSKEFLSFLIFAHFLFSDFVFLMLAFSK